MLIFEQYEPRLFLGKSFRELGGSIGETHLLFIHSIFSFLLYRFLFNFQLKFF